MAINIDVRFSFRLEFNVPFQHKYGYIRDEGLAPMELLEVRPRYLKLIFLQIA